MDRKLKTLTRRAFGVLLSLTLLFSCALPALAASGYDCPGQKLAALTFDDGPGPYSDQILDVLKKHGAKATFFMNGFRIEKYPDQVRRMAAEGHQVANHTYDHPQLSQSSNDKIRWEVDSTAGLLTQITGLSGTGSTGFYLRAPYGDTSSRVTNVVGVPLIQWNVDSQDWKYQSSSRLISYVGSATANGDIVLMHESHKSTANGLDGLLTALEKRGFELVTVEELLWRRGVEAQPGRIYYSAKDTGVDRCARSLWYDESHLDKHWAYGSIRFVLDSWLIMNNEYGEFMPNYPLARRTFAGALGRLYRGTVSADASPYEDVPIEDYEAPYILWAREAGIMEGVSPTRFEPQRGMTRQEMAAVLARCARFAGAAPEGPLPVLDYKDETQIADWARDDVALCTALGLFQGSNDGCFHPDDAVTRAVGAIVLERLAKLTPVP